MLALTSLGFNIFFGAAIWYQNVFIVVALGLAFAAGRFGPENEALRLAYEQVQNLQGLQDLQGGGQYPPFAQVVGNLMLA